MNFFGAKDGLVHISELAHGYVKAVSDVVAIGDTVKVKVINVDDTGRIKLSRRALMEPPADGEEEEDSGEAHTQELLALSWKAKLYLCPPHASPHAGVT